MSTLLMCAMAAFIALHPLLIGGLLMLALEHRRWQSAVLAVLLLAMYLINQGPQISCLLWSVATSDLRHWKT